MSVNVVIYESGLLMLSCNFFYIVQCFSNLILTQLRLLLLTVDVFSIILILFNIPVLSGPANPFC